MGVNFRLSHERKKSTLNACSKKIIRRKFGPEMRDVTSLRKLHNKENHTFYSSQLLLG